MKSKPFILVEKIMTLSYSSSSDYGQAIADYVQTDRRGAKYDMKFKAPAFSFSSDTKNRQSLVNSILFEKNTV
jgi:hypothetical protein